MQGCAWTFGGCVEEWHFPRKPQVGECTTDRKHGTWNDWTLDIRQSWWNFLGSEICFTAVQKECATPPHIHPTSRHMQSALPGLTPYCKQKMLGWEGLGMRLKTYQALLYLSHTSRAYTTGIKSQSNLLSRNVTTFGMLHSRASSNTTSMFSGFMLP